jgi:hypothetical protein
MTLASNENTVMTIFIVWYCGKEKRVGSSLYCFMAISGRITVSLRTNNIYIDAVIPSPPANSFHEKLKKNRSVWVGSQTGVKTWSRCACGCLPVGSMSNRETIKTRPYLVGLATLWFGTVLGHRGTEPSVSAKSCSWLHSLIIYT